MDAADVLAALQAVSECRVWVGGGWGVDALAGRETRQHRDLDLAVDARDEAVALIALAPLGYEVQTDWRPVRVELAAPGKRWVDVHPVVFDAAGDGVQAGPEGATFAYPRTCFVTGTIGGVSVG
jgi:lincosamide nucleotidyltransferase A/C/D/E